MPSTDTRPPNESVGGDTTVTLNIGDAHTTGTVYRNSRRASGPRRSTTSGAAPQTLTDAFPPLIVFGVIQTSVFGRIGGSYMKLAPVAMEAVVVPRMRCPFSVCAQWPEYVTAEESSSMNCALTLLDPEIGLSDLRAAEHIRSRALEAKLPGFEYVAPGGDAQGALDILFDDEERGAGVRYLAEHVQ